MTTTKIRTALTTIAVAAALAPSAASAAQAGAAQAPDIGPQKTLKAGKKSPLKILGTSVKKGSTLKQGQKLVSRTVRVDGGDTARFTITCGAGWTLAGITPTEGGKAVFNLDQKGSYVGRRSVKLRADTPKDVDEARGTMYALCVR